MEGEAPVNPTADGKDAVFADLRGNAQSRLEDVCGKYIFYGE